MAKIWGLLFYCSLSTVCRSFIRGGITQTPSLISVTEGDDVHLSCFYSKEIVSSALWMKQPTGENTITIASLYASSTNYHNGFDNSGRFQLESGANSFNLTISQTQTTDSATYYCGFIYYTEVMFGKGSVLFVKREGIPRESIFELQPEFESVCSRVSNLGLSDEHTQNCMVTACTHILSGNRTTLAGNSLICEAAPVSSCVFWGVLKTLVLLVPVLVFTLIYCVRRNV